MCPWTSYDFPPKKNIYKAEKGLAVPGLLQVQQFRTSLQGYSTQGIEECGHNLDDPQLDFFGNVMVNDGLLTMMLNIG
jgi:hypothetical protein